MKMDTKRPIFISFQKIKLQMDQDLTIRPGALNLIDNKVENSPKYTE